MKHLRTYAKNTGDIVRKLEGIAFTIEDWCLDVESLYTSIPHSVVLAAGENVLD